VEEPVVVEGLEGVGQGVAVVERGPQPGAFVLVGRDDGGLDGRGAGDDVGQDGRVAAEEGGGGPLVGQRGGELPVAHEGVLGHLAESGPVLPVGEARQGVDVADDRHRLVEGADEVLALGQVDAGLAADRRVDLGQERRRHLEAGDPAVVGGGREPGGVTDHAAAEGRHGIAPQEAPGSEAPAERLHRRQALRRFAVVHEEDVGGGAGGVEGGQQGFGVPVGDGRLADDGDAGPAGERRRGPVEDARPDDDVVAPGAEIDADGPGLNAHAAGHPVASRTAVAACPGERPAVSTRTWAAAL
jgi:hypothetical protein